MRHKSFYFSPKLFSAADHSGAGLKSQASRSLLQRKVGHVMKKTTVFVGLGGLDLTEI